MNSFIRQSVNSLSTCTNHYPYVQLTTRSIIGSQARHEGALLLSILQYYFIPIRVPMLARRFFEIKKGKEMYLANISW